MKRFLVFCFEQYEQTGGLYDFNIAFDRFDEAKEYAQQMVAKNQFNNYSQILDVFTGDVHQITRQTNQWVKIMVIERGMPTRLCK